MGNIKKFKSINDIELNEFYGASEFNFKEYIKKSNKYKIILIDENYSDYVFKEIYDMQINGDIVIILYPEKLEKITKNIEEINHFLDAGCLFILDAKSLEGDYGRSVKNVAKYLLEKNIYNFIIKNRVSEDRIENKIIKFNNVKDKLLNNLECLVNDEVIEQSNRRIKKKKLLGIF